MKRTRSFDPHATLKRLRADGDKAVVAADIGGDKITASRFDLRDGNLRQSTEGCIRQGEGGSGYVDFLLKEVAAGLVRAEMLPVGISFAGPTEGNNIVAGPNVPVFVKELDDRCNGVLADLFPAVAVIVANDAEAGLMAGALEAAKRYPETRNVIYVINGSGIGGAVLTDNTIFACEPGHVQVDARLNLFGQRKPCGVFGATYVCVESVAASKAGLEDIWFQQNSERLSGREIAAKLLKGDELALSLYDSSALATAHIIKGIARAFGLPWDFDRTVVVGHGGIFHVPGYGERVGAILANDLPQTPKVLFTKDFSANACLDGAAVAAVAGGRV